MTHTRRLSDTYVAAIFSVTAKVLQDRGCDRDDDGDRDRYHDRGPERDDRVMAIQQY